MPIPTELVGSLPRPMKLQDGYADYDEGKITWDDLKGLQDKAAEDSIKRLEAIGDQGRHRRRAARVELRDLPDHRHARRHRAGRQPRRRRPVLRDLRRRPPPPAAAADGRPVPLQDVRVRVRREEPEDRIRRRQAGRDRAVDADAALPARGRAPRLLARRVPRRPLRRGREGHPPVLRRRRGARVDRLHRGPAREQERLAQPVDRQGHAAGVHRSQQPRDRSLHRRGARQHRHPHVPGRRLRLGALQGRPVRETAAQDVPAQRRLLPDPVRVRGRPRERLQAVRRVLPRGCRRRGAGVLHGRRSTRCRPTSRRRSRSATSS